MTPDRPGFSWLAIRVEKALKGNVPDNDQFMELLHDTLYEAELKQGSTYILFLTTLPGYPWQVLCGFVPPAELSEGKINGEIFFEKFNTLGELEKRINTK
jgi:hypothetical protein